MSNTLERIRDLVMSGSVRVSSHGYDELSEDGILAREVIEGIQDALVVEDYPAVLVTAYNPDPTQWSSNFLRRKS